MFLVVGGVYVVATCVFGAIPLLQYFRAPAAADELNGATRFETFRISTKRSTSRGSLSNKRSTSRGSIANGVDSPAAAAASAAPSAAAAMPGEAGGATIVSAYGAMASSTVDVGGQGYGYGGGVPDWNDTRHGSQTEQSPSPPTYGSWQ